MNARKILIFVLAVAFIVWCIVIGLSLGTKVPTVHAQTIYYGQTPYVNYWDKNTLGIIWKDAPDGLDPMCIFHLKDETNEWITATDGFNVNESSIQFWNYYDFSGHSWQISQIYCLVNYELESPMNYTIVYKSFINKLILSLVIHVMK